MHGEYNIGQIVWINHQDYIGSGKIIDFKDFDHCLVVICKIPIELKRKDRHRYFENQLACLEHQISKT